MRLAAAWVLAAFLLFPAAAEDAAAPPTALDQELALLQKATEKYKSEDMKAAAPLLKQAVEADSFSQLTPDQQYWAQRLLAGAAYANQEFEIAQRAIQQACTFDNANDTDWYLRFLLAYRLRDNLESITSLTVLAEKWPARLADLRDAVFTNVGNDIGNLPSGKELQARLLKALFAAHWQPTESAADFGDFLWLTLARYYLDWRDMAHAKEVAAVIVSPGVIATMRSEKAFDEITAADPDRFDIDKAFAKALERAQARMAAHPELLEAVNDAAIDLYRLDKPSEALALLDGTLARIRKGGKSAFKDQDDNLNWTYDVRSRALKALGRNDEAIEQVAAGAHLNEHGEVNVSQVLNLANDYANMGRPKDALATLAGFDASPSHASPYGLMVYQGVRTCAYAQLQDGKGLAESLAYIAAHSEDGAEVAVNAMLCAGDVDGAAKLVVAGLGDPDKRSGMLRGLQILAGAKGAVSSHFQDDMDARWTALRQRQDVLRAVEPFGRILTLKVLGYD